jgi:hypothetical protein
LVSHWQKAFASSQLTITAHWVMRRHRLSHPRPFSVLAKIQDQRLYP